VGRLENIIARNRRAGRPPERVVVMIGIGVFILLILVLAVFTDLGTPPDEPSPRLRKEPSVDGVQLRRAR
jgi:hypothetical protein